MMNYGFSIIMPTYNRSELLLKAIKSVCKQNYYNWEIIIVDDNSKYDCMVNNKKNIDKFNNANIKYYYLETNHGHSYARNFGILKSCKDWIVYLDDDNVMVEKCLERLNSFLNKHKDINVITSKYLVNYVNNNVTKIRGMDFIENNIFTSGQFDTCCFFHSKKYFEKLGGWNVDFKRMADDEIIFRYVETAIKELTYAFLPECIAQYNIDDSIPRVTNLYGNFKYLKIIRQQHDYYKNFGKCLIVIKDIDKIESVMNGDYDTASFIDSDIVTNKHIDNTIYCDDLSLKNIYVKFHDYKFFLLLNDEYNVINDLFFEFKVHKNDISKKNESYFFVNSKELLKFVLKNK